jgi:hypothetical protein
MLRTGIRRFNGLPKEIVVVMLGVALTLTVGFDLTGSSVRPPGRPSASAASPTTVGASGKTHLAAPSTTVTTVAPPTTTTAPAPAAPASTTTPPKPVPIHTVSNVAPAPKPVPAKPVAAPAPAHSSRTIALGDYAGWVSTSGIARFASATGTHPTMASDYLDRVDGWAAMDNGGGEGGWAGSGYRLVLGVPILPGVGTLAQGATGAYNQYFTTLAQNLVAQGEGNAILRLGWEFTGNWYPWSVTSPGDAANFVSFWQQIVTTMRAVPGAQFSFLWNPNGASPTSYTPDAAYPGNAYVDYIGTDVYDEYWGSPQTPQGSWANVVNESWGLSWLASFAASHGKPIAFPEWSVCVRSDGHGLGDDPYFINQFANWIASNNVAFTNIFSFNDTAGGQDNDITDGNFPNALAAFRTAFG